MAIEPRCRQRGLPGLVFGQPLLELQRPRLDLRHLRGLDTLRVLRLLHHRVAIEGAEQGHGDRYGTLGGRIQTRPDHGDQDRDPHEHRAEQRQQPLLRSFLGLALPLGRFQPELGATTWRRLAQDLGMCHLNTWSATFRSRTPGYRKGYGVVAATIPVVTL